MFAKILRFNVAPLKELCFNFSFKTKQRNLKIQLSSGIRWKHFMELNYYLKQTPNACCLKLMDV